MSKFMSAEEAVKLIKDGDSVAVSGNGGGIMEPNALFEALERRFLNEKKPRDLTLTHSAGIGDKDQGGISRFVHEGMVKRVVGGHWGWSPKMQQMANENQIEAYNLPQGIITLQYREIAAKRVGVVTQTGLKTFVDPRISGGKLNDVTREDLVELIQMDGQEWLRYKTYPVTVALIRGSIGDEEGNISLAYEPAYLESMAIAQAVHNCGGIVICQVKFAAKAGTLNPKDVRIPGILVDAVVVNPGQQQTIEGEFNPALTGDVKMPVESMDPMVLDQRKVVARRAAMELAGGSVINLGFGMPDGVARVAAEEGISGYIKMTIEQGIIGGVPAGGAIFGVAYNSEAMIDGPSQFDFYSGGGLDLTCLGLAQADSRGNVNVSKFGPTIAGCGGFIDISQTAKKCVFCGTFTAGGLKTEIRDGKLNILKEGRHKKFLKDVEHITFSGDYARETNQSVLYVTERAVFEMTGEGLVLKEIAPGADLQKDILDQMDFVPLMPEQPSLMDERIFRPERMGLSE
ncbi:acyl CoA:acetate/3-ketoacid CoA transferase [Clostridium sp. Marseille-P2415]|uniref:acyl CoA:acetate/3-ketoacid CoA transferase n=1 Tax=Clostridium sp. Marseille-P2415 TaxID=1805471 RepID=UPI0009884B15|nr:acyl CoA:acetate/3-ketoacid CoA transferase [Clostridium sp. Marseille-P2415]